MKPENITKAAHSIGFASDEVHAAYNDACKAGDEFYILVLEAVLEDVRTLDRKIKRIAEAHTLNKPTKDAITTRLKHDRKLCGRKAFV